MGWVTEVPIRTLLEAPLPPDQGGYAAVVFVVSRAEGDGLVHRQHLDDWSSIHDLTGRHIAVITPDPSNDIDFDRGVVLRGVALFGGLPRRLLADRDRRRRRASVYAPSLPMRVEAHATAVTTFATELQEYFGIAEQTLPCVVIVCTRERQVVVVGLTRQITVYGLLKHVKSVLEPHLARLNQVRAELERCSAELDSARAELAEARRRASAWHTALAAHEEWVDRRARLAVELTALAADADANTAQLLRWLAARLPEDRALERHEASRAETLFTTLHGRVGALSSRERRSLLRRLRRVVAALGTNVTPVPDEPDDDVADLAERVSRRQATHDAVSSAYAAQNCLDIVGAVRSAADRFGLDESPSALLPWRESRWPVTAFVAPPHRPPSVRRERG